MTNTKKFRNCLLLLTAAIIWGMAFVSQQAGMDFMGPLTFNGSRNIIGSVILVPVILIIRGRIPKAERKPLPVKTTIIGGLACGAALTIASTLQQYGLTMTTVGKGGFITTLYIILTPILGIFIGRKAPKAVWFCAVLAVAGMFLLCVNGESLSISAGDLLVLGSALVFAVHILVIDHFSPLTDGVILSCIQFAVCGKYDRSIHFRAALLGAARQRSDSGALRRRAFLRRWIYLADRRSEGCRPYCGGADTVAGIRRGYDIRICRL